MNVTYSCPGCQHAVRAEVTLQATALECPHCRRATHVPGDAFADGQLCRCLVCPSTDLFVRKDFPQRLGVLMVVAGILASCVTWYYSQVLLTFAILFGTALVDVVLYLVVPNALMCYRCGAQYRLAEGMDRHGEFDLATHERHRQQAARMAGMGR